MKKRIIAALCALLLLCALPFALPRAEAAPDPVYFMSVNDTVMDLNDATMPFFVNGVLYVPYTMFDPDSAGSALGIFSSYSRSKAAVLIYGWGGTLLFDLQENSTTFGGKTLPAAAILRNSTVFVPLDLVCSCFNLEWSWLMVNYGYIIRVKNNSAALNDRDFASAAAYTLKERYNSYVQNKAPKPTATATPSPSPTPPTPSNSTPLRFAFLMGETDAGFNPLLSHLKSSNAFGLFLCHPDDLMARDDDIRTLLATGHKVGLLLDADTPEGQLEQLEQGKKLLSRIAHVHVTMAYSTGLDEVGTAAVADSVLLWQSTVDTTALDMTSAQRATMVTRAVTGDDPQFILLDDSATSASALEVILAALAQKGCEFRPVTEVSLSTLNELNSARNI